MSSRLLKGIITGVLTGIVGLIVGLLPFGLNLEENVGLEFLFKMRGRTAAPSDVVVVSIDKESYERLNLPDNPDKWPRSIHARLTENLAKGGAKVIAFDVHFIEARLAEDDKLFSKAIREARNCVLCEPLKPKEIPLSEKDSLSTDAHSIVKVVKPLALFADPAAATAPFVLPRIPFKVNQYWNFQTSAGDSPTLPVVAFQLFTLQVYEEFFQLLEKTNATAARKLPRNANELFENGNLKGLIRTIREIFESDPMIAKRMLDEMENSKTLSANHQKYKTIRSLIKMYQSGNSRYINYYGPPRTITTVPYHQALQLHEGTIGEKKIDLKGKAVFVGLSEILLAERKDSFYTVFSQANGIFISGVEIAATAFANLLEERPLKPVPLHFFFLIILLWGVLVGILCRMAPIFISALGAIALSLVYLFVAVNQFKAADTWYPTVIPLLLQTPLAFFGALVWNYVEVNKERQNIKRALGYHLPKEVVEQIAKDIVHVETGAQVVYGICLFTDVEQYTTLSETMEPMELGRFMNRYYETMFKPVKDHGGYVSGVIGDSMLALWAATSSEAIARQRACIAAVDIIKELELFFESPEFPRINTRIGLHCGHILLGHIGALDHYEYTPMGDIVNTASRVEGLNKVLGTWTLVSGEVINQLVGFLSRELGRFKVAGKIKPVVVHELLGRLKECDASKRNLCEAFTEARETFRRRSWDQAIEKFQQIIATFGDDGPSRFYLKLSGDYKKNPPEEPWDEVIRIEKK